MGWSESFARRVFSTEKFYPSFEDLPRFCAIVGNTIIIQWLLAKAAFHGLNPEHQSVDCRALLLRVTDIFTEVGDVATEARAAVQDNLLQPGELRRLLSALQEVLEDGMRLVGDLRAMQDQYNAQHGARQRAPQGEVACGDALGVIFGPHMTEQLKSGLMDYLLRCWVFSRQAAYSMPQDEF